MSANSPIEWTDHTFNIAWGCEKVSPGCAHCYADTLSSRYGHDVWGKDKPRRVFGEKHWAEPLKWNRAAEKEGIRKRVFCSSMCDVFEEHPTINEEREKLWPLIRATPWLDWQLLTKRPDNILGHLPSDWGLDREDCSGYSNVWLGTSVENQRFANRVLQLCVVPARVRFLSMEPLLGFVDLADVWEGRTFRGNKIHWVIVGGESGPKHRPMRMDWARCIRDQCADAGVPFFLKQLGGPANKKRGQDEALLDGVRHTAMPVERVA